MAELSTEQNSLRGELNAAENKSKELRELLSLYDKVKEQRDKILTKQFKSHINGRGIDMFAHLSETPDGHKRIRAKINDPDAIAGHITQTSLTGIVFLPTTTLVEAYYPHSLNKYHMIASVDHATQELELLEETNETENQLQFTTLIPNSKKIEALRHIKYLMFSISRNDFTHSYDYTYDELLRECQHEEERKGVPSNRRDQLFEFSLEYLK
jgi:hypothetical protein